MIKWCLIVLVGCAFFSRKAASEEDAALYKIAVIGTGYVGLASGACLAEFGHKVICCDIDAKKIALLNSGTVPIFETGLPELIHQNRLKKRLEFTCNIAEAIQQSDIIIICVGTPVNETGKMELAAVENVAKEIGKNLNQSKMVFLKSTVPIGETRKIRNLIQQNSESPCDFEIAFFPEFFREGTAVYDFCNPERVVIGSESKKIQKTVYEILSPLYKKNIPFFFTSFESAEAIKIVSNCFLAVKISFINEIANLCDATGADVLHVAQGIGLDSRIGKQFLSPGPGFGGYCLPKDTQALLHQAKQMNIDLRIIQAAVEANHMQSIIILQKLISLLGCSLQDKIIAILGLAFKANTDDVRESPALKIISELLKRGARIKAYDPKAMPNTQSIFPELEYCPSCYETCKNADAVMILTEWKEFKTLDWNQIRSLMNQPIVIDARNVILIDQLKKMNFKFENVGRSILRHEK